MDHPFIEIHHAHTQTDTKTGTHIKDYFRFVSIIISMQSEMFTKQPTVDMDIEFDIKLLATEYFEGTVCIQFYYSFISNSVS